jgi:nitroimidazol reductase NimA-like FMN-containing flavoprotein (pyridoxamine 5'-phosphate oxidase superfamily)
MKGAVMTNDEPIADLLPSSIAHAEPMAWEEARRRLARAHWYWLATVRPDERPHAMPLLAVWLNGALYLISGASIRIHP